MALAVILKRSTRTHLLPSLLHLQLPNSSPVSLLSSSSSSSNSRFRTPLTSSLSSEPISSSADPNLSSLLHLITNSKYHPSTPRQEALDLLLSSEIEPTEDLVCSAIWALRSDWESAVLAFKWARDRVMDWPEAWHLMIWVLGNGRRFDLAWSLVRRMHRKSVLTTTVLVILMERLLLSAL